MLNIQIPITYIIFKIPYRRQFVLINAELMFFFYRRKWLPGLVKFQGKSDRTAVDRPLVKKGSEKNLKVIALALVIQKPVRQQQYEAIDFLTLFLWFHFTVPTWKAITGDRQQTQCLCGPTAATPLPGGASAAVTEWLGGWRRPNRWVATGYGAHTGSTVTVKLHNAKDAVHIGRERRQSLSESKYLWILFGYTSLLTNICFFI